MGRSGRRQTYQPDRLDISSLGWKTERDGTALSNGPETQSSMSTNRSSGHISEDCQTATHTKQPETREAKSHKPAPTPSRSTLPGNDARVRIFTSDTKLTMERGHGIPDGRIVGNGRKSTHPAMSDKEMDFIIFLF
jgi:hypothetical protein